MTTDEFWRIVQRTHRPQFDEEAALAALTRELSRLGEPGITAFEKRVLREIAELDTPLLREVADQLWVLSDESWLHFRAWCVSEGREFVQDMKTIPGRLLRRIAAEGDGPFDPPSGALFLFCAEYARVAAAA
jgi:hypothetical protein